VDGSRLAFDVDASKKALLDEKIQERVDCLRSTFTFPADRRFFSWNGKGERGGREKRFFATCGTGGHKIGGEPNLIARSKNWEKPTRGGENFTLFNWKRDHGEEAELGKDGTMREAGYLWEKREIWGGEIKTRGKNQPSHLSEGSWRLGGSFSGRGEGPRFEGNTQLEGGEGSL